MFNKVYNTWGLVWWTWTVIFQLQQQPERSWMMLLAMNNPRWVKEVEAMCYLLGIMTFSLAVSYPISHVFLGYTKTARHCLYMIRCQVCFCVNCIGNGCKQLYFLLSVTMWHHHVFAFQGHFDSKYHLSEQFWITHVKSQL